MNRITRSLMLTLSLALVGAAGCASANKATPGVAIVGDHIELEDHIHFATGKAEIKSDSFDLLNRLAFVLNNTPDIAKLHIHGHTDNTGSPEGNKTLSADRANAVLKYLTDKGVKTQMDATGMGQEKPLCTEDTDECRSKNRRVELIIERS